MHYPLKLIRNLFTLDFFRLVIISIVTLFVCLLEIYAYQKKGVYSLLASKIWLGWSIYYFVFITIWALKIFYQDIKTKEFWGIISFLVVITLTGFMMTTVSIQISGETMIQITAGLENWQKNDLGITETAFLGHPSRQFLLTSLPSLLWGRSLFNYRLIYWLIFILSIFHFYSGLRFFYSSYRQIAYLATLAIIASFSFPVILLFLRSFDMSIFNPSYFYFALGSLLIAYRTQQIGPIIAFTWALTMLANSHTPALAAWVLLTIAALTISICILFKHKNGKVFLWILCSLVSLVFGYIYIQNRQDVRIPQLQTLNLWGSLPKIFDAFNYFFINNVNINEFQLPFIGHIIFLPTAVYLTGAFLLFWNIKHLGIALWIVSTVAMGALSPGYAKPPLEFAIYRALVVLPVIIWGIVDVTIHQRIKIPNKLFFVLFVAGCLYIVLILNSLFSRSQKIIDPRAFLIRDAITTARENEINLEEPIQLGVFTKNIKLEFMPEHLSYFFPKHQLLIKNFNCLSDFNYRKSAIIYFDSDNCTEDLTFLNKQFKIGTFTFPLSQESTYTVYKAVYKI